MNSNKMGTILRLLGVGWYVGLCIGGGALGGLWVDRNLDVNPVFTLIGLGLGIVIAGIGMYRILKAVFFSKDVFVNGEDVD